MKAPQSGERREMNVNMNIAKTLTLFLTSACASLAVTTGLSAQDSPEAAEAAPARAAQLTLADLRTFTDIFNQVRKNYVEEVDDRTLLDAAIRGMLLELDPHSDYLAENEFERLNDNTRGAYSGIGIDVQAVDGAIRVNAVIDNSPADEAGIGPGDLITSIDGEPVRGAYLPDMMDSLSGEPDTSVGITVRSPDGSEREVTLIRRYIQVPTLSFRLLDKSYGYFRISGFHRTSAEDLESTLDSIGADGVVLRGVVIDLRDNPGGVLKQAVAMADGFLDEGLIVSLRGRNSVMQMEFRAQPGQWLPDTPVLILVDRGTASASEVLAGALQDNGRALIVGERTFGKGSVQSVLPLRNGSGIKLTTARYYTPSGRSIQAEGIRPDVVVGPGEIADAGDDRLREADLDRHLDRENTDAGGSAAAATNGRGAFPLNEALGILRSAGILNGEESMETKSADGEDS